MFSDVAHEAHGAVPDDLRTVLRSGAGRAEP